jgi:segregation and condensation protein B
MYHHRMGWHCSSPATALSSCRRLIAAPLLERFLNRPTPEPLSQAAMEVLSIVAYEQSITRAEISHIRGTDSSGVIETLLARQLTEDDPRFRRPRSVSVSGDDC